MPMQTEDFDRAEDLLHALAPTAPRWHEATPEEDWIFRGQADAQWRLVPSILREGRWTQLVPGGWAPLITRDTRDYWRWVAEFKVLREFMRASDKAGLAIPEDSQAIRSLGAILKVVGIPTVDGAKMRPPTEPWPPAALLSLLALAQHYGVPTRLLDWTWKPRVAAYFAAVEVAMGRKTGIERIAVWAWNTTVALLPGNESKVVEIVTAPQATNPNLAAQAGVFTLVRGLHDDAGIEDVLPTDMLVSEGVGDDAVMHEVRPGPLLKMTLPSSEARRLLALLGREGVHAATVFPGYKGVVESLAERACWT